MSIATTTASTSFQPLDCGDLPIFRLDCGRHILYYAPGCLCAIGTNQAPKFEISIVHPQPSSKNEPNTDWAAKLRQYARAAQEQARQWRQEPYCPECLTLYLNNECNLSCVYCYADPSARPAIRLRVQTAVAAAEIVAQNCQTKARPFYIVFHGGGEPALHWHQLRKTLAQVNAVADEYEVESFRYIATNGVMPEDKARWLARNFDLVGISCDGPADIHNDQRPHWNGHATLHAVEHTTHILREEGCPIHVRSTITRASLRHQAAIADYVCQQLFPQEIHFEPVYAGKRSHAMTDLMPADAGAYTTHFFEARAVAVAYDIPLFGSGSRPGSIHGPYCQVYRQVLNLVPGGLATACFKLSEARQVTEKGAAIGALVGEPGRFRIDDHRVQELRQKLDTKLPECARCFNAYHCAQECPDYCPLDEPSGEPTSPQPGFRCQVQQATALGLLKEAGNRLWREARTTGTEGPHGTTAL